MLRPNFQLTSTIRSIPGPARLFAAGPPPQTVADWLRSNEAAGLKTAILDAWKNLIGSAPSAAPTVELPQDLIPATEFNRRFTGICALSIAQAPGYILPAAPLCQEEIEVKPYEPMSFYEKINQQSPKDSDWQSKLADKLIDEIDDLANIHNIAWSIAHSKLGDSGLWDLRDKIKLSGYEMRAYLYHLAYNVLKKHNMFGWDKVLEPLENKIKDFEHVISAEDVTTKIGTFYEEVQEVVDVPPAPSTITSTGQYPLEEQKHLVQPCWRLTAGAKEVLIAVSQSYATALDVILSFVSSQGAFQSQGGVAQPPATARIISESDLPYYYDRWIGSFARLLEEEVKQKESTGDNLLVLRLIQRTGRYGEIPQRSQAEELAGEPREQIWPEHPTARTEAYALEPIPERYWRYDQPTVYLRQDYALGTYHRGYGIGQNIYSMSLLPEEEQTIIMKSFKDTKTKVTESTADNIFEEIGSETAQDFAKELAAENQQETNSQDDFKISGKASVGFIIGSAEVESGYNAQSSEKDFTKSTSNFTEKQAQKSSAKRTVTADIKRTRETEEELHSEINTERKIKNPNMGHTVTFHWFQMTRKYNQELTLEDMKLTYTSGKHNIVRIFKKGDALASYKHQHLFAEMPQEVARRMPPNSAIVVVTEPYTEVVSMAGANAFLARVFKPDKAVELNSMIWQVIGFGAPAPDGLGVAAFSGPSSDEGNSLYYAPLYSEEPSRYWKETDRDPARHVAADRVAVRRIGVSGSEEIYYLPNLDLRYQLRDGLIPSRYTAEPHNPYSLPRLLMTEERIINTNGVFCDAMVGQCTALEDYLQRHRDLDLLEKKIQVGQQEIEFKWALAKDGLVEIFEDKDASLVAVVKEGSEPFKERIEVERAKLAEQKAIAEGLLEKQKLEKELELLNERVNELKRKIELMGTPPEVKIDAPEGADIAVKANLSLGPREDNPIGGSVTVE